MRLFPKLILVTVLGCVPLLGNYQQQTPADPKVRSRIVVRPGIVAGEPVEVDPVSFAPLEIGLGFLPVKDSPFSAELTIETDRKLADGNSLRRVSKMLLYRDGRGRSRIERISPQDAATQSSGEEKMAEIRDPGNAVDYFLIPKLKVGFRMRVPLGFLKGQEDQLTTPWSPRPDQSYEEEDLGNQRFEGYDCEGIQETVKIPPRKIGNPYPIEIVTERWFSSELQLILFIKHEDPRSGNATLKVSNISREEPPATLFEIPPGYKIQDGGSLPEVPPDP